MVAVVANGSSRPQVCLEYQSRNPSWPAFMCERTNRPDICTQASFLKVGDHPDGQGRAGFARDLSCAGATRRLSSSTRPGMLLLENSSKHPVLEIFCPDDCRRDRDGTLAIGRIVDIALQQNNRAEHLDGD